MGYEIAAVIFTLGFIGCMFFLAVNLLKKHYVISLMLIFMGLIGLIIGGATLKDMIVIGS